MPSLADIPFLSGWTQQNAIGQQQGAQQLQQVGLLAQLQQRMQAQQEKQKAADMEARFRAGLRPDMTPEQRLAHAAQFMGPEALGRMDQGHLDRDAGRTATAENARLQREAIAENQRREREAQAHNITLQGQQAIERVRVAERERRITKEEADRREAGMRESTARLIASLRPEKAPEAPVSIYDDASPTGFRYGTRAEAVGQAAPAPSAFQRRADEVGQRQNAADYALSLVDRLESSLKANPRSTTGMASGLVRGFEAAANTAVPGVVGSQGTIAAQTKEALITALNDLKKGGAGRLSNQDMMRIDRSIGQLTTGTPEAMAGGLKDTRDLITILRGSSATTSPQPSDKFEVGKVYQDAGGNKAKYLGSGRWEEQR